MAITGKTSSSKKTQDNTKIIRQNEMIPAKPSEVYEALTNPAKHSRFTGAKATGQAKIGGTFTAWDGYISGRYLDLEKGKRILAEWKTAQWPANAPPSILDFTFEEAQGGTRAKMVHARVPSSQANMYSKGWVDHYWKPLKAHFGRK